MDTFQQEAASLPFIATEQLALLPSFRDRYLARALSTESADWDVAREVARDAYPRMWADAPRKFVHAASPMEGIRIALAADPGPLLRGSGFRNACDLGFETRRHLREEVIEVIEQALRPVRDQTAQLWTPIWNQFLWQLRRDGVDGERIGSWEVGDFRFSSLALQAFARQVLGVRLDLRGDLFDTVDRLSAVCGWCWPFADVCVIVDRPECIRRDEAHRLHCANGPAVRFRDGWCVYAWHGYRIPVSAHWIITDRDRLTPESIEAERNAELRRVMLEAYGFERYLAARDARVVSEDVDVNGQPRRLLEVIVAGEPLRILEVINGTVERDGSRRRFLLGAMPGETPADAVAASYGFLPRRYREAVRT